MKSKWYEREQVEKINSDWVKLNCKITRREKELLEIIKNRKMVRRDMLEIISPSYRNIGDNRTLVLNKSIRKLFVKNCIDKAHESKGFQSGNTPAILSLDRAGSMILGVKHKPRIKHVKSVVNGKPYTTRRLPANFRHINGVNQLEVDTILFCEEKGWDIVRWIHEKPQELHYGGEKVVVIPDIAMELKTNTEPSKSFIAFIEFDTGSESIREKEPRIIRDKVIKYKKYKLSKLWENDFQVFPVLILVTEDEKRTAFFNRKCKENGLVGLGVYYENYKKFLERLTDMV